MERPPEFERGKKEKAWLAHGPSVCLFLFLSLSVYISTSILCVCSSTSVPLSLPLNLFALLCLCGPLFLILPSLIYLFLARVLEEKGKKGEGCIGSSTFLFCAFLLPFSALVSFPLSYLDCHLFFSKRTPSKKREGTKGEREEEGASLATVFVSISLSVAFFRLSLFLVPFFVFLNAHLVYSVGKRKKTGKEKQRLRQKRREREREV